jgi:hypothetical protein
MSQLPPIPEWAAPSLQGLAYWLGSQYTLGLAANISEGAIAWELSRLLFTHRKDGRLLEAEVFYRDIPELNIEADSSRADLVITKRARADRTVSFESGDIEAIIEIKHNRSAKLLVWRDIDFLGAQRKTTKEIRAYLIYTSINARPNEFTGEDGSAITPRTRQTPKGTRYRVRRVCRATKIIPRNNENATGHYAVLIEVVPGAA